MAELFFDVNTVPDDDEGGETSPIPSGEYFVMITGSGWANTQSGGKRVVIKYLITHGDLRGVTFRDGFNLKNASADTVRIAKRQLKQLCQACGKRVINDSEELHAIPIRVRVKQQGKYNNVVRWDAIDANATAAEQEPMGAQELFERSPEAVSRGVDENDPW